MRSGSAQPRIVRDVALGSGSSCWAKVALSPSPSTMAWCGVATSARIPHNLRPSTSTSLGHLSPAWIPLTSATASTIATPAKSGTSPHRSGGTSPTPIPTDMDSCVWAGAPQERPWRPRPAV
ncbi:Uncharacterised protein [Mycobacteroides abscessus subsp. abscessus]|nr:Uncharacterised protein [Mycobacteroides abscessus subsp. abscessus]